MSENLEARATVTSVFEGEQLKLDRSFSQQYNFGLTYTPRGGLSVNLTYIHSRYNGLIRTRQSSFTGYISYAYRRFLTAYLSVNRRIDRREQLIVGEVSPQEVETRPRTINGQLLIYVTPKVTLSGNYLKSKNESILGQVSENESIQGILTIQF
jgi:hypothetical protein